VIQAATLLRKAWRPHVLLASLHVGTALLFVASRDSGTTAAASGLPLDDSWIHLVYARGLAAFEGFAYNPGAQEAGSTSPLWSLLLAPLHWLKPLWGGNVVYGAKVLGVACAWVASLAAFRVVGRLTSSAAAAYAAAAILAVDPSLTFAKVSGMEVSLAVALPLGFAWCAAEGRLMGAVILLALAPLARPEHLLLLPFGGAVLAALLKERQAPPRTWALALAPVVLVPAGWSAFCQVVAGHALPNTWYVKHIPPDLFGPRGLPRIAEMLARAPWMWLGSGAVLAVAGVVTIVRAAPRPRVRSDLALRALLIGYPPAFLIGVAATHNLQQAAPFYWARYAMPGIAGIAVLAAIGWGVVFQQTAALASAPARRRILVLALAAAGLLSVVRLPMRFREQVETYSWNSRNIDEVNVALGRWAAVNVAAHEWIAANDAGAIRYLSERPVLDLIGLNNASVLRDGRDQALKAVRPRWMVVDGSLFPHLAHNPRFQRVHAVRPERYTICDGPNDEVIVYRAGDAAYR
jgi:hypothetical protein